MTDGLPSEYEPRRRPSAEELVAAATVLRSILAGRAAGANVKVVLVNDKGTPLTDEETDRCSSTTRFRGRCPNAAAGSR